MFSVLTNQCHQSSTTCHAATNKLNLDTVPLHTVPGLESSLIEFVGADSADGKEAVDAYVNACKKKRRSTG